MRIVGAVTMAGSVGVLLLGALGLISTAAAVSIFIVAVVVGIIIVAADSL